MSDDTEVEVEGCGQCCCGCIGLVAGLIALVTLTGVLIRVWHWAFQ